MGRQSKVVLLLSVLATWVSADGLSQKRLEADVRFLADDQLEGRGTPSRGLELAALYLATELRAAGWEPGSAGMPQPSPYGWQLLLLRCAKTETVKDRSAKSPKGLGGLLPQTLVPWSHALGVARLGRRDGRGPGMGHRLPDALRRRDLTPHLESLVRDGIRRSARIHAALGQSPPGA